MPLSWSAASACLLLSFWDEVKNYLLGLCLHSIMFFLRVSMLRAAFPIDLFQQAETKGVMQELVLARALAALVVLSPKYLIAAH